MIPRPGRLVILRPRSPATAPIAMRWAPAQPSDVDWYWLDLSEWIPPSDVVSSPTVVAEPIIGDANPPSVLGVAADTGTVMVTIAPGIPYTSTGPRIRAEITGGSSGNDYVFAFSWLDDQGRSVTRSVMLLVR